jgi:hypothetical protein
MLTADATACLLAPIEFVLKTAMAVNQPFATDGKQLDNTYPKIYINDKVHI